MPKVNTTVKAVRVDNDRLAELEERLGNQTFNSWMNGQIMRFLEVTPCSENEVKGVNPSKIPENFSATPYMSDIEEMLTVSGMTTETFLSDIAEMMNNGEFDLSGKNVKIIYPSHIEEFIETCHDCCLSEEEAFRKATKALRKGSI